MKILQVINSLSSGGAEVFAVNLSIELNKLKNNNVHFLIYHGISDKKGQYLKNLLSLFWIIFPDSL